MGHCLQTNRGTLLPSLGCGHCSPAKGLGNPTVLNFGFVTCTHSLGIWAQSCCWTIDFTKISVLWIILELGQDLELDIWKWRFMTTFTSYSPKYVALPEDVTNDVWNETPLQIGSAQRMKKMTCNYYCAISCDIQLTQRQKSPINPKALDLL